MDTVLTTTWSKLLAETNKTNTLTTDEQHICERKTFHKLMDEMARIGWLRIEGGKDGIITRKVYRITFEGAFISAAFAGKL
jgi:hypothetical protein